MSRPDHRTAASTPRVGAAVAVVLAAMLGGGLAGCAGGGGVTVTPASGDGGPRCAEEDGARVCVSPAAVASGAASPAATADPTGGPGPATTPSPRPSASPSAKAPAEAAAFGGGRRVGTYPTSGTVHVAGQGQAYRGAVKGSCDVVRDVRTATVKLPRGGRLVVDVTGPTIVTLTAKAADGRVWTQDYVGAGDVRAVLRMTPTRTVVSGARLPGPGGAVTVDADLAC